MPPGGFGHEHFPCKVLAFFRDSSEKKHRLVVHPCDHSDHRNDARLVKTWNLHCLEKQFDAHEPKASTDERAKGKTIKEKRLVPQVATEEEDVLDERTCCIKETPTIQETTSKSDLASGRRSKTVLCARDRKFWPTLFVDNK